MEFLQALDLGTLFWFGSIHRPWLDAVMENATWLGNTSTLVVVVLLAAVGFVLARQFRHALLIVVLGLSSYYLSTAVKDFVNRPRPDVGWRTIDLPNSASFPSGHAFCSMAIYPGIALLAARHLQRRSRAGLLIAASVALALLIGTTRMYLGVHYLTDVVGGWIAGLACALLTLWVDTRWTI